MNIRKYGKPPFEVAVLHGGPGAPGYMAPVARELSRTMGVLEPLQSKDSLEGQIEELKGQLGEHADTPVILIGSSWGSVLALFLAARHKELVEKLILVGSAVFDAENSSRVEGIRLSRLSDEKRRRHEQIMYEMQSKSLEERSALMKEWGEILDDTDCYDPLTKDLEVIEVQYDIFAKVWPDFVMLRDTPGYLKKEFSKIDVPTMVMHGDYDPHPIEGIRPFLESCIEDIRFHILPKCGHYPWIERKARDQFFEILHNEVAKF
jgi:pimeloyl-ACP methyl ester carboxylesterase